MLTGPHPIAFGSLELDATDENDVNGVSYTPLCKLI